MSKMTSGVGGAAGGADDAEALADQRTVFDAAFEAGIQSVAIQQGDGLQPVAMLPRGVKVETLERILPAPIRKRGLASFVELGSFGLYAKGHAEAGAAYYADRERLRITAVLNGHVPDLSATGWGDHRAALQLRHSETWAAWAALHRKWLPQAVLVDFLEDRLLDIADPPSADLVDLISNLKGQKKVDWAAGTNLRNGTSKLTYDEQVTATDAKRGEVTVPDRIILAIPVFYRASIRRVDVRLRWKLEEKKLLFQLIVDRFEDMVEEAFGLVVDGVQTLVEREVYFGTPSSDA